MTQHDVSVVLTGYVGPKAFHSLAAVGIKIGQNLEGLSVRVAVEKYKSGQVSTAEAPNRTGGRP
jgi:predicted Fe-Mo cluster-binding NifX family protein